MNHCGLHEAPYQTTETMRHIHAQCEGENMWGCAPIGAFSKKKMTRRHVDSRHCATVALSAAVAQFRRQSRTAASPFAHTVPTAASGRARSRTYRSKAAAAPSAAPQPRKWTTSSASGRHLCASTRGPSNRAEHLFFFFSFFFFLNFIGDVSQKRRRQSHNPVRAPAALISPAL